MHQQWASFFCFGVFFLIFKCLFSLLAVKFNVNNSRCDLLHHISNEVVFVTEAVRVLLTWQQNTASNISLHLKHQFEMCVFGLNWVQMWVQYGKGRSESSCKLSAGVSKTEEMAEILRVSSLRALTGVSLRNSASLQLQHLSQLLVSLLLRSVAPTLGRFSTSMNPRSCSPTVAHGTKPYKIRAN